MSLMRRTKLLEVPTFAKFDLDAPELVARMQLVQVAAVQGRQTIRVSSRHKLQSR